MNIGILFSPEPKQWGLRGDPHLWREMKEAGTSIPMPDTEAQLTDILTNLFTTLTGGTAVEGKNIYVPRYPKIGMSAGRVCGSFWIEKGFPLLSARFIEATTTPSGS